MIYPRLCVMQRLLSVTGSIFIHLDWHVVHYVKVIMDEIFKLENFRNEIIIKRTKGKILLYQFKSIDRMHNSNDSIHSILGPLTQDFHIPLIEYASESKWMGFGAMSIGLQWSMKYSIMPERGQWKWSKDRALKSN